MGRNNRFREDALKYWDIKCEDAWTRFEEAVRENPYLTAKEFCAKDMGCVDPFMRWTRRTKHNITRLRQQALDERKKAKVIERRNSAEEWTYILSNRENAANLLVEDVTVCGVKHCLVIAPDACLNSYVFDKTKKSYDAADWATAEAAGLVCLPPAGYRDGTDVKSGEGNGFYWASTTDAADKASNLGFKKSDN